MLKNSVDLSVHVPRISLNRAEVATAIGVSANTVDLMVQEGFLPRPRKWHSRKVWLISEVVACMAAWPQEGLATRMDEEAGEDWRAST